MIKILPPLDKLIYKPHFIIRVTTHTPYSFGNMIYHDQFDVLNEDDEIIIKKFNNIIMSEAATKRYETLADMIYNSRHNIKAYDWASKWAHLLYHYDDVYESYESVVKIEVLYYDENGNKHAVEIK